MEKILDDKNYLAVGSSGYSPNTITIGNCEHIFLTQKGIDIKVDVHTDDFDKIEEIIINGRKFKKVEL